ncbi:hypothetical protein [Deinococcus cellulosilyticus]|uniref:Uncharacterized protein n=1 Tax=Deinococcus cellulosilyticus (strain DSM 18568 / NBRC 106333 / KACC 11606 / 5516J-15) TaxID=1223518 RepID=A0A511MVM9_DEIC1|nr:hypothetical protein [Deinococcus cellulosilyticus]GEM44451.1 hypothetical protein DC3_00860 [Deinococcus cellulosilyticus NBRC 106333 = KACC 11606]
MKSSPLSPLSSPFQNDPEYPLYLYGSALVHSARVPALLLWMGLNLVVLVRNFGGAALADTLVYLKVFCMLMLLACAVMIAVGVRLPTLRTQTDGYMKSDMLYTQQKNVSMQDFSRSHLAQLLGKVGTFTCLHLLVIQLCAAYQKYLG